MEYVDILKKVNKNEDWKYDDNNPISNFLKHIVYYYKNDDGSPKFRLGHDCDAFYYKQIGYDDNKALFADSILSFWMPYQSRLQILSDEKGKEKEYDFRKPNKRNPEHLDKFITLIETTDAKIIDLNKKLFEFTKLIYTKGNFMKLPQISKKYSGRKIQERGTILCDEIDWSIYQCHNGGIYFKYFDYDESNVSEWIKQEKLEMADKPFLSSGIYKTYYDMTDDEFYEYLDKAIELIEYRNTNYHPEEFAK